MKKKYITYLAFYLLFITFQVSSLEILFYTHAFPEFIQPFVLNQIVGLIKRGHEVTILAPTEKSYAASFTALSNVPKKLHADIVKHNLLARTYYKKLPLHKRVFDVILCQQGTLGENFLKEYKKKCNIKGKIITFLRGRDITARLAERPERYKELFSQGALFLPVCKYFKNILIQHGCPSSKILVLHAAIDCKKFRFKERELHANSSIKLITTGRLVEKKGIEYAIRAVAQLSSKYPQLEFSIIGGGPLEEKLKALVQELNIGSHVKFLGWRTQDEVANFLDTAHIFLLPAVTAEDHDQEGISNALKEAMACGLPVIATYHSGNQELVEHGISGYLVHERNIDELAEKIEYLIQHSEKWSEMGKRGRKKVVHEYDMEIETNKLEKICNLLVKNKKKELKKLSW